VGDHREAPITGLDFAHLRRRGGSNRIVSWRKEPRGRWVAEAYDENWEEEKAAV